MIATSVIHRNAEGEGLDNKREPCLVCMFNHKIIEKQITVYGNTTTLKG